MVDRVRADDGAAPVAGGAVIGQGGGLLTVAAGTLLLCAAVALIGRFVVLPLSRSRRCPHVHVRCTHGDERLARRSSRICVDCRRALDGPLPEPCSVTGMPHEGAGGAGSVHCEVPGCDATALTDVIHRTSPTGGPFLGRCGPHYADWLTDPLLP